MKFFIAGKEIHSDKKLETGSLQNYSELGFESVYSHLLAKRFLNSGLLNAEEDIVVTCEGREFFYDNHIKTLSWAEYEKYQKHNLTVSINAADFMVDSVLHETSYFHDNYMVGSKPYQEMYDRDISEQQNLKKYIESGTPKYKFYDEDYNIITDFNFNKNLNIPNKKYICLNRRHRKHREELNMPVGYTLKLIETIQEKFNTPIYVTGFHNEKFLHMDGVTWVSLRDWCTLINNENCMALIQNQTGTANLSQLCAKENLLNIVLDMEEAHFNNPLYLNGRRPDVLGKAVNFKNLKNIIFKKTGNIDQIIDVLKKYA